MRQIFILSKTTILLFSSILLCSNSFSQQACFKDHVIKVLNGTDKSAELPIIIKERITAYEQLNDTLLIEMSEFQETVSSSHGNVTFIAEVEFNTIVIKANEEIKYSLIIEDVKFNLINTIVLKEKSKTSYLNRLNRKRFQLM